MKRKHTSVADCELRFVLITLDNHVTDSVQRAATKIRREAPGVHVAMHATASWGSDPSALERCLDDIAHGDIIVVTMLFMEDQIKALLPALQARREHCDAMICAMSAAEVMKLTRMGRFSMDGEAKGPVALLKRLRGKNGKAKSSAGAQQMTVLRQLPKILRFIPGTAQDVRVYFLTLQYWLASSDENLRRMICELIDHYAAGEREALRGQLSTGAPLEYPETGLYDPARKEPIFERVSDLPRPRKNEVGTVGVLIMRSYALAGNSAHYDRLIATLRERGLRVITAFASGLDARPAVEKYFIDKHGKPVIDALLSLTGFSLVGGPAYNDTAAAEEMLRELDVPYIAAHALEFQSIEQWENSTNGLMPVEATMMVAIPELDGATQPTVYGGRSDKAPTARGEGEHAMRAHPERVDILAARIEKLVALRHRPREQRRLAIVLFNFPPHSGNTGTAANLAVFQSLYNTLSRLRGEGYDVDVPDDVEALRSAIVEGNAAQYGALANVHTKVPADEHVAREPHLAEIEAQWGPVPGKQLTDGRSLFVMGAQFGNVFVGVQPGFGYEGDPMRLLFERGFTPTHAFTAFYRWIREDFGADALLHFGTHGALEFMPGKQVGMGEACWPQRLIGDTPHYYLYAANNPSEGTHRQAPRRRHPDQLPHAADHPCGPLQGPAGTERVDRALAGTAGRRRGPPATSSRPDPGTGRALDLCAAEPAWNHASVGRRRPASRPDRARGNADSLRPARGRRGPGSGGAADMLAAIAEASHGLTLTQEQALTLLDADADEKALCTALETDCPDPQALPEVIAHLRDTASKLPTTRARCAGACPRRALRAHRPRGRPAAHPEILPTGRNLHGFDPFRLPSKFAMQDGQRQTAAAPGPP
jgi:magnesium chelatase subunit H